MGDNTGNLAFWYSINRLFDVERIPRNYFEVGFSLKEYDCIITTDLIWVRQHDKYEYLEKLLDDVTCPIIPISVGLQSDSFDMSFKISEEAIAVLNRIQERCVIGVRGEYTARILWNSGIRNIAGIGCPSMYMWNNPELKISGNVETPNNALFNYKTFYGFLSQREKHFLEYAASKNGMFVEQTELKLTKEIAADDAYYEYINNWLEKNTHMYFSIPEWLRETCLYDFSMGGRFHGNVIALWNNIKSLFVINDSRTREMTAHFHLPAIERECFDKEKDLKYYYDLADYSDFNALYKVRYQEFMDFINSNGLEISKKAKPLSFAGTNEEKLCYCKNLLMK